MNESAGPLDILSKFMMWLQYPDYYDGIPHFDAESASRSDRSINRIMSTVLEFYQYLAANNKIQQIEAYRVQMISGKFKSFLYELVKHKREVMSWIFKKPVTNPPVEAISREQYNILFAFCRNTRDRLLLALLYEGGLRLNEALGLHICDLIDIEDNIIHIVARDNNENGARVKLHAEGTIYLPEYVVDLLLEYLNNSPESSTKNMDVNPRSFRDPMLQYKWEREEDRIPPFLGLPWTVIFSPFSNKVPLVLRDLRPGREKHQTSFL